MNQSFLELQFAQLQTTWKISEHNRYSSSKKIDYQSHLKILYEKLKDEDFSTLSENDWIDRSKIINFIFKSLEFLDHSTQNLIPFEIITCLEKVLEDWVVDKKNNYIIVTSLVNTMNSFSFDPSLVVDSKIYTIISATYNMSFSSKLIQINLPRYLSKDYLANVALYHELGHFVETQYSITAPIVNELWFKYSQGLLSDENKKIVEHYFSYLVRPYPELYKQETLSLHFAEYFSDIFAAQYIGEAIKLFLQCITPDGSGSSYTHPSIVRRTELIDVFLSQKDNYIINLFNDALLKLFKKNLKLLIT